jgi:hypothetical protein
MTQSELRSRTWKKKCLNLSFWKSVIRSAPGWTVDSSVTSSLKPRWTQAAENKTKTFKKVFNFNFEFQLKLRKWRSDFVIKVTFKFWCSLRLFLKFHENVDYLCNKSMGFFGFMFPIIPSPCRTYTIRCKRKKEIILTKILGRATHQK